jgi:hypothetical protein
MIHEFALDPEVLNSWQSFRFFIDQFGIDTGRMISRYPGKWKRLVYEACANCGDIDLKRIESSLQRVEDKLLKKSRPYANQYTWLENVTKDHKRTPFHAIISGINPSNLSFILIGDNIEEKTSLWNVERECSVLRKAEILADTISPLLLCSTKILFVDPHFDPDEKRYRRCLKAFLDLLQKNEYHPEIIEYHISGRIQHNRFLTTCLQNVQKLIPSGFELVIKRWDKTDTGDKLHPRYVLTERGGIRVEHGLDEGNSPGATTDISLLADNLYKERWKDYHEETSSFEYLEGYSVRHDSIEKL